MYMYHDVRSFYSLSVLMVFLFSVHHPRPLTKSGSNKPVHDCGTMYTYWVLSFPSFRNFKFNDTHVEGARVIAEACKNAGVEKLIHFSALGAKPDSKSSFMRSKVIHHTCKI